MHNTTTDEWDGEPLWAFRPNEVILADFRAVELLGVGKRCESWLADSPRLGRVVLKICRPHQLEHPRGRRAMVREAEALSTIRHPGVRALIENRMKEPFPALVLAHAPGESLSELVDFETLPVADALVMIAALIPAVAAIHEAGLIHLDLKPTNVIVDRDFSRPLLIDLGSSRPIGFDPGEGTPLGSPGYAPPELERNEPVGRAVDVYGLGTILYEALTGEEAFDPDLDACDRPAPPRPSRLVPTCPPDVDELVVGALAVEPKNRPDLRALADATGRISGTLCGHDGLVEARAQFA